MAKRIIICCDGTGNQFGEHNTNVVKLIQALDLTDPAQQIAFYDPGVGTGNPRGALTFVSRGMSKILGLAFGTGFYRNIADAYGYLIANYEPGDAVYVFGFSRGAYTARALVGMLHMVGLIRPGGANLIPYALEMFRVGVPKDERRRARYFAMRRSFKKTYSRDCPIRFLGVWDTVKTIGLWDALKIMVKWQTALPFTSSLPGVQAGRHAISIDERRSRFRSNLWAPNSDNAMQQVWFAGVHSDVGGGYKTRGLSNFALRWMLVGAEFHDILLRSDALVDVQGDAAQKGNTSLKGAWFLLGWKRRVIRGPGCWHDETGRWLSGAPSVHESVQERMKKRGDYRPKIPDDAMFVDDRWESYDEI